MATPAERNALLFLAALAALGLGVRGVRATRDARVPHGAGALDAQIMAVDSATAARRAAAGRKAARPTVRGTDTAARTAARRSGTNAPRAARPPAPPVPPPDVAEATAGPMARYEARRRAVDASNADARRRLAERQARPAAPPSRPPPTRRRAADDGQPVDLDTADEATIATVPWIGPALAARIVDDRARNGPFGSLAGLQRVRGIGPGLAERVRRFVAFSRPAGASAVVIPFRRRGR